MPEFTICQVLHGMQVGGAEVLADRLARRLSPRFRFVFACLDQLAELGETLQSDGFPVKVVNRGTGIDWRCARRLSRFLREQRVDMVHAHQYTPFFYSLLARFPAGRPPILFNEHGRFHPDYPRRKRILFNRLALRKRDRVAAVGAAVARAVIENEGIPADRVGVIYNGINLEPYQPNSPTLRDDVRSELQLSTDDFVVAQVARLDYLKDHLTALRTIARVKEQCPSVRLLLIGEGPEREPIEREIDRSGLGPYVRLLGTRRDVPRLLCAADACLLTSISEGIPLTLIEAMAAGLPIVSTDVGGVGEVVAHGETAFLSAAGEDGGLADDLVRLSRMPEVRTALGARGALDAAERFSEELMHQRYAELYTEMLGANNASATASVTSDRAAVIS